METDISSYVASLLSARSDLASTRNKLKESKEYAEEMERKLAENSFTLADYLDQIDQLRHMGPLDSILKMMPGVNQAALRDVKIDDKQIDRMEAIILSMTPLERRKPQIINSSRKKRIAAGCGLKVEDVNRLLKQFEQTQKMM